MQGDTVGGLIITGGYAVIIGGGVIMAMTKIQSNPLALTWVGLGLATVVTGFARPYMFNNRLQAAPVMNRLSFEPVSDGQGKTALRFGYTLSF